MIPGFVHRNLADWIFAMLMLALIYMMARPNGIGPDFIKQFTGSMVALIGTVTDIGGDAGGGGGGDEEESDDGGEEGDE